MNSREIIISAIVLILLLAGFYFVIRFGGTRADKNTSVAGTANIPTTNDLQNTTGLDNVNQQAIKPPKEESSGDTSTKKENKMLKTQSTKNSIEPPTMQLKDGVDYQAVIKTSMGDIKVDLFEDLAPITVNNFVYLARNNFYDGVIFHRVIDDFMIQGGDPTGTGTGGPGYSFKDEINDKKLVRGSLAMANAGPNTNGSQFFIITAEATPWLDGKHTNFGQVLEGQDVVDAISKVKVNAQKKPLQDVVIKSVEIIEN